MTQSGSAKTVPHINPLNNLPHCARFPNLVTIRPADANEVREAWKVAVARRDGPTALALTRQNVPTFGM